MIGTLVGATGGLGVALIAMNWRRRVSLIDRVAPYAGVSVRREGVLDHASAALRAAAQRTGDVLSSTASVRSRLQRAGSPWSVDDFRIRQFVWGVAGFALCAVASTLVDARSGGRVGALLVLCLCGFFLGAMACDQSLSASVRRREQRMVSELPVVAELLALAVAVGETPTRGLQRILRIAHGPLADELGATLAAAQTGSHMPAALDALSRRTGVVPLARFADGLAVALERGTPLVDVLHSQAADVREASRRQLMESGGRREVAMMVPVVFGILPTTVVFAFYPGLVGLQMVSGR